MPGIPSVMTQQVFALIGVYGYLYPEDARRSMRQLHSDFSAASSGLGMNHQRRAAAACQR